MKKNRIGRVRLAAAVTTLTGLLLAGTAQAANADPDVRIIGPGPSSNRTGVICIQLALDLTTDGQYGQEVYDAVMAFQEANGLSADGAVGRATGNALYLLDTTPAACWAHMPTY